MLAIRYTIETLSGQLTQTCQAVATETATILELVEQSRSREVGRTEKVAE